MYDDVNDILKTLPPDYDADLLPSIQDRFRQAGKTLVVLDDDPTGTQTCYDVVVITDWSVDLLTEELRKAPSILFILSNSRSLATKDAVERTLEIGRNLALAVATTGRPIVPISRSDSTLRGHFPQEVAAIADALGRKDDVWLVIPAFIEGRRYTLHDIHYIVEGDRLIPVSETPFARDNSFGYRHSNLKDWVSEKSKGAITPGEVFSISIDDIRIGGPQKVCERLLSCRPRQVCIVNAVSTRDLEVVVMGMMMAEETGRSFLTRTSATFVPIRAGMRSGKIVAPQPDSAAGALVVVGSYVPKTTSQLEFLLSKGRHHPIEIKVSELLTAGRFSLPAEISNAIDELIGAGKDVVVFTSRTLETGIDADTGLAINRQVSDYLVDIVSRLRVRPSVFIAKGGITSSDLASRGLSCRRALILGQALPGVPVWRLDQQSKFPDLFYIVFPGNVGDVSALWDVCKKFKENS